MNSDEIQTNAIKIVIAVMTWAATHYLPADANAALAAYAPTIAAGVVALGTFAYGVYRSTNMKLVPETATALHLDGKAQPVGTVVPAAVVAAAKVVGTLLIGFMLLQSMPAMAQANLDPLGLIKKKPAAAAVAPKATATTSTNPVDAIIDLMTQIEQISATTITNVIADIMAANADASAIITPATATTPAVVKDPISAACYPAAIQFLQSLPVAIPPTGVLIGVQLFQKKRDFIAQIQAGLPVYLKLGCAPLLGDEITTFVNLMAMVGVKILPAAATLLMPALAPITLPALTLAP